MLSWQPLHVRQGTWGDEETEASAMLCSHSRRLTQGDIQLPRGMQQERANDNGRESAGLCSHLRPGLALLCANASTQQDRPLQHWEAS